MKRSLAFFIFLFEFSLTCFSQGSVKVRRWNVQVSAGTAFQKDNFLSQTVSNEVAVISFSVSNFRTADLNLDYCLIKTKQQNSFFKGYLSIGLKTGLTMFDLHTHMDDYSTFGHFPYTYRFDTHDFRNTVYRYDVALPIGCYLEIGNVFVLQRLSLMYTGFTKQKVLCKYNERVSHSYPQSDPSAPGGWIWITEPDTYESKEDEIRLDPAFSVFYSLSAGYRIKRVMALVYVETTTINNSITFKGAEYKPGFLLKHGYGLSYFF